MEKFDRLQPNFNGAGRPRQSCDGGVDPGINFFGSLGRFFSVLQTNWLTECRSLRLWVFEDDISALDLVLKRDEAGGEKAVLGDISIFKRESLIIDGISGGTVKANLTLSLYFENSAIRYIFELFLEFVFVKLEKPFVVMLETFLKRNNDGGFSP